MFGLFTGPQNPPLVVLAYSVFKLKALILMTSSHSVLSIQKAKKLET